jgi:hypothetical protein
VLRATVPEAAVHEHHHTLGREGQVRASPGETWKGCIDSVSESPGMQESAQGQLCLCVATPLL